MTKSKTVEEAVDDWLGFNDLGTKPMPKEKLKSGGKLDVTEAVNFMSKGQLAEAQLAIGLLGISHEAKLILAGGLTRDALFLLIQNKVGYVKGNLVAASTIEKVLEAAGALSEFVDQEALERVRAARSKR